MLGAEDEAAQLLSNEHALARTSAGMTTEQFTPTAPTSLGIAALPSSAAHYQTSHSGEVTPLPLPALPAGLASVSSSIPAFPISSRLHQNSFDVSTPSPHAFVTPSPSGYAREGPPALPYRIAHPGKGPAMPHVTSPTNPAVATPGLQPGSNHRWKFMDDTGKLRKVSGRLFTEPSATLRRGSRVAPAPLDSASKVQAAVQARQHKEAQMAIERRAVTGSTASPSGSEEATNRVGGSSMGRKSAMGKAAVLQLLQALGEAYSLLSKYHCQEATEAFHKLSPAQFNTGWVLCQLGRAYYEMVDYPAAANVFEFARQADPHRLEVAGAGGVQHSAVAHEEGGGGELPGTGSHCPGPPLSSGLGHHGQLLLPAEGA